MGYILLTSSSIALIHMFLPKLLDRQKYNLSSQPPCLKKLNAEHFLPVSVSNNRFVVKRLSFLELETEQSPLVLGCLPTLAAKKKNDKNYMNINLMQTFKFCQTHTKVNIFN